MTRDDWSYLSGAALTIAGASCVYWPAGLLAAGGLLLLPRFVEWFYVLRNGKGDTD